MVRITLTIWINVSIQYTIPPYQHQSCGICTGFRFTSRQNTRSRCWSKVSAGTHPVSGCMSFANRWLSFLDVGARFCRSATSGWVSNGQPQPSVAGTLLFPVQIFGTGYQNRPASFVTVDGNILHDTCWRHTCSAALYASSARLSFF